MVKLVNSIFKCGDIKIKLKNGFKAGQIGKVQD